VELTSKAKHSQTPVIAAVTGQAETFLPSLKNLWCENNAVFLLYNYL
jgi:hypothetical protein